MIDLDLVEAFVERERELGIIGVTSGTGILGGRYPVPQLVYRVLAILNF